jgi:hypothetical protein
MEMRPKLREEIEVMARAIWVRMRQSTRKPEQWDALPEDEKSRPRRLARAAAEALAAHRAKEGNASGAERSVRSEPELKPEGDRNANPIGDLVKPDGLTVLTQHLEEIVVQLEEARQRSDEFIRQRDAARAERDAAQAERDVATAQMEALRAALAAAEQDRDRSAARQPRKWKWWQLS